MNSTYLYLRSSTTQARENRLEQACDNADQIIQKKLNKQKLFLDHLDKVTLHDVKKQTNTQTKNVLSRYASVCLENSVLNTIFHNT